MRANGTRRQRERLDALLPSYLKGTLRQDERRAVEEWLAADPSGAADALERAKAAVDNRSHEGRRRVRSRSLFRVPPAVAWATAAVAVALLLLQTIWPSSPPQFTSSVVGIGAPEETPFVLVSFNEDATIDDISRSLSELGLQIISGPMLGGVYRVGIPAASGAEFDEKSSSLEASPNVIWLVAGRRPPG